MHTKTALVVLSALVSSAAIGCGSGGGSPATDGPTGAQRASLHRAKSCGDLLGDLKADAIYKLNHALDRQIEIVRACQAKYGDSRCAYGAYVGGAVAFGGSSGVARESANDAAAPSAPAPSAGASSSSGGTGGAKSESAGSYSETNTQVKGVDEADIVKNDGKNLYVIHGRAFKLLNAWPANELREVSTLDIEGNPTEMFVADGKVVVYSQVNGAAIFTAAGVTPKEQYQEYGYGGIGVATDVARGGAMPYPGPGGSTGPYVPLSKVTVLQLDGTTPRVTREVYFEGNYLDSRRVGSHVRTVFQGFQYGPKLKYSVYDLYPQTAADKDAMNPNPNPVDYSPKSGSEAIKQVEELRAANVAIINASQLGDWLPYTFVRNGAQVSAQTVACEDFYVPSVGSTQSGLTEVSSLDLADPAATPKDTAILGRADTVYGSADTLYLAANAWVEPPFQWNDNLDSPVSSDGSAGSTPPSVGTEPAPAPTPAPGGRVGAIQTRSLRPQTTPLPPNEVIAWSSNNTHIHKFEFKTDPKFPNYVASGTVHGSVKNQFSLDDKDGYLRIATTESRNYVTRAGKYVQPDFPTTQNANFVPVRPNSVNHLFVMGQNGPWLDTVGDVGELALNEQIYSVRFVESRGYVVTFRQVDPLFVVDLANPQKPNLLAALKIPGFSEYMHPLGNNHLLTIGRDATETGRAQGLQLQIFDVTNGSNPLVKHKFTYTGDEYGSSEAQYDHKAFTYFAEKGLLAFPYYSYNVNSVNGGMRSSLELFRVDLGSGFTKIGSIDHTSLLQQHPNGYCGGYYGPSVRRGVFLENFVYSISYGGVVVRDANNLAAQGPQLALPSPIVNDGYGPVCAY